MLEDPTIERDNADSYFFRKLLLFCRRKVSETFFRKRINRKIQSTLSNCNFSIISNNCLGGVIYHDAGKRFLSPTINLAIDGPDFIRFLSRPNHYLGQAIRFKKTKMPYPVGEIDDIEIRFVHYKSEQEAASKWVDRSSRIDWDNVFVICTDRDGLYKDELLDQFDRLPYKNKLMFTSKKVDYSWAKQINAFRHKNQCGIVTYYSNFFGKRYFETAFNLYEWIKSSINESESFK